MTGKKSSGKAGDKEIKMAEKLSIFTPVLEQCGRPEVTQVYKQDLLIFNPIILIHNHAEQMHMQM